MALQNKEPQGANIPDTTKTPDAGATNTPASTPAGGSTPTPATANKGKKETGSVALARQGMAAISAMSEDERKLIGSKSHTLVFNQLLGQESNKSSRRVNKNETETCATSVGANVTAIEDVLVPVIPITRNWKTGLEDGDVTYTVISAGTTFDMSLMELMLLLSRDEFGGFMATKDDPQGVRFSPKVSTYYDQKQKLPTPALNLVSGAIKESITAIDFQEGDTWKIRPEYAEKFGDLMKKSTPKRTGGAKTSAPSTTTRVAKAISAIEGIAKNLPKAEDLAKLQAAAPKADAKAADAK